MIADEIELEKRARELVTLMDEADAGRVTDDDFGQALDRIWGDMPDRDKALLYIRAARLRGQDVAAIDSSGDIIGASSDAAEALMRRTMNRCQ
jgi:hypothetical protein